MKNGRTHEQRLARAIAILSKKERNLPELAKLLKLSVTETGELLIELGKAHPGIQRVGTKIFIDDPKVRGLDPLSFSFPMGEKGKIGVLSCTHLGSKYMQLSMLYKFYERLAAEKVDCVLHCGDLTDGNGKVYRGQRYEMFLQGFDELRDYTIDMYPRLEINGGFPTTYVIAGNHDDSFVQSAGADICREICNRRDDMVYLGRYVADILLNNDKTRFRIHHGGGRGAYAISWKLQKCIEALSPDDKPQVYLLGHFHRAYQLFLRNIHGFEVGCFQAQTPFAKRFALPQTPAPGGWIIEYEVRETWGIDAIRPIFVPYYVSNKDDWKNYPH